jgi:hypothetical protein
VNMFVAPVVSVASGGSSEGNLQDIGRPKLVGVGPFLLKLGVRRIIPDTVEVEVELVGEEGKVVALRVLARAPRAGTRSSGRRTSPPRYARARDRRPLELLSWLLLASAAPRGL